MEKKVVTPIRGYNEVGCVVQENAKTLVLKFHHIPNKPVLTVKKKRCQGILGYKVKEGKNGLGQ